jgi:hypothetical protein
MENEATPKKRSESEARVDAKNRRTFMILLLN